MAILWFYQLISPSRVVFLNWIAKAFDPGMVSSNQLVSQVMQAEVSQMVDPNYTILVKFPKKYLPEKKPVFKGARSKLK
jgi:acetamidase/formamidase